MTTLKNPHLVSLSTFLQDKSHIQLTTSASPEYHNLREIWALDNTSTPLAIVRPQTSDDVSHLIKFCSSSAIKFTIRSGGHNIFGSSIVQDALCIDLRSLKHVFISSSKTTATIGGGILINELAKELQKEGLVAASTEISSVGYVGWASCGGGGYGPFMRNFGLGVDQIIGAKVVDANGEVKDADEKLLKGIRGAGGAFGVIVEMTIKVYPLKEVSPLTSGVLARTNNISVPSRHSTIRVQQFDCNIQELQCRSSISQRRRHTKRTLSITSSIQLPAGKILRGQVHLELNRHRNRTVMACKGRETRHSHHEHRIRNHCANPIRAEHIDDSIQRVWSRSCSYGPWTDQQNG